MTKNILKDQPLLLQTLMDSIEGEIFIKDAEGKYIFANKAIGKDFGVDPMAIIGKDDFFVFPPDIAAKLQENDKRIMAGKMPVNIEESGVIRGKHVTYLTNKVPLIDEDGNVFGICGVGTDITQQKKMEKELSDTHQNLEEMVRKRTAELSEAVAELSKAEFRYRTVADFTFDWEYWANMDGTLKYVSPSCERISGYSPQQFIENPSIYREIVLPEDMHIWEKHYHDSRSKLKAREIQFRIRCRDGTIRWIEHVCQPVSDDQGGFSGFRASNRDITKRKQREIELKKAYSEISELKAQLEADRTYLCEEIKLEHDHDQIIGESEVIKYVLFRAERIAPTDTTVLILGETGTGKELIARAIHSASRRNKRPLIKVDCASLPVQLIESELFGHEKGAFTGATGKRMGRFELANGATLFLDEVGELPLELQPKLLRVLQDGEFERLGSSKTQFTDVRIIAATNRQLDKDVRDKKFRMDLWYRLNVFSITLPPLRERSDDIVLLVNHMKKRFEKKHGKHIGTIPANVMSRLRHYDWPGNVRELENIIERIIINSFGKTMNLDDSMGADQTQGERPSDASIKTLDEVEREHILLALQKTNWKIYGDDGAAAHLGINPNTLRSRMRKKNISRQQHKM